MNATEYLQLQDDANFMALVATYDQYASQDEGLALYQVHQSMIDGGTAPDVAKEWTNKVGDFRSKETKIVLEGLFGKPTASVTAEQNTLDAPTWAEKPTEVRQANAFDPYPNFPAALKNLKGFVTWKGDKNDKQPYQSGTLIPASYKKEDHLVTYAQAIENIRQGKGYSYLGLVPVGGYVALDLDSCRNPQTGDVLDWAKGLFALLPPTYANITPSGGGLRPWLRVPQLAGRKIRIYQFGSELAAVEGKEAQVEVLTGRYATIDGEVFNNAPSTVAELSEAQWITIEKYLENVETEHPRKNNPTKNPAKTGDFQADPGFALLQEAVGWDPFLARLDKMEDTRFHGLDLTKGKVHYCPMPGHGERGPHIKYTQEKFGLLPADENLVHCIVCGFTGDLFTTVREFDGGDEGGGVHYFNYYAVARKICEEHGLKFEDFFPINAATTSTELLDEWMEFTDIQNSEQFVNDNWEFVRANWSKQRTTWYVWDGARWKEDAAGAVLELAKKTAKRQLDNSLLEYVKAMTSPNTGAQAAALKKCKAAKECCSDFRLKSLLNLAAAGTRLSVSMTDLDGQPNLINFKNGTLDLETLVSRPHRKEDLLTQLIPIDYDPNAKCPLWELHISRLFRSKPYLEGYIQRVVGYLYCGRNPQQVFFICHGVPGGGKTTFGLVLKAMFGEYFKTCPQGLFLLGHHKQNPNAASPAQADLYGSRLVISEELDEDEMLDCSLVKVVTGSGGVKARPLYKPMFEYMPDSKLMFLTNYPPRVTDFSGALEDRLRIINLDERLRGTSEDVKDYHNVLLTELPGIVAWAIRGLAQVKANGLQDPEEVKLATKTFMLDENIVLEWSKERTEATTGTPLHIRVAHADFLQWARQRGEDTKPMTQRWFGLRMTHAEHKGKSINGVRVYENLRLRLLSDPGATVVRG